MLPVWNFLVPFANGPTCCSFEKRSIWKQLPTLHSLSRAVLVHMYAHVCGTNLGILCASPIRCWHKSVPRKMAETVLARCHFVPAFCAQKSWFCNGLPRKWRFCVVILSKCYKRFRREVTLCRYAAQKMSEKHRHMVWLLVYITVFFSVLECSVTRPFSLVPDI